MAETGAAGGEGATARTDAPYRAQAVRDGGQWHLTVRSLDDHPDRGEVDALVITVTPREPAGREPSDLPAADLPAAELDRTLEQCGFGRDGDWTARGEGWTAPCRQSGTRSAPPAPPVSG